MNPVRTFPSYIFRINCNVIFILVLGFPSGQFDHCDNIWRGVQHYGSVSKAAPRWSVLLPRINIVQYVFPKMTQYYCAMFHFASGLQ
jgi:hypothetical protein